MGIVTLADSEDALRTNEMNFETFAELYQALSAMVYREPATFKAQEALYRSHGAVAAIIPKSRD